MGGLFRAVAALVLLGLFILGILYGIGFYRDVVVGHQDPGYYTRHFIERITGREQPEEIREAGRRFRRELNREASIGN